MKQVIYIGYEPRETNAYLVAVSSIRQYWYDAPICPISLDQLRKGGLYQREIQHHNGQMFDIISRAPMSTEFAISRFFTPILAETGWAIFMDCDMLIRTNLRELFDLAEPSKAVMCVKHEHDPENLFKMDAQIQLRYQRKNWSSVMLWNCDHPANKGLTIELLNSLPGRDLHALCWLKDEEIGELGMEWNWLADSSPVIPDPKIVHFTNGIPSMPGFEECSFSAEWKRTLQRALDTL